MIFYAVSDLIFASRIRSACDTAGRPSRRVADPASLEAALADATEPMIREAPDERDAAASGSVPTPAGPGAASEASSGSGSGAAPTLLVDLELGDSAIAMIESARSRTPAPRTIAFGSHVARDVLARAREAGADEVMPRSRFVQWLEALAASSPS